MQKPGFPMHNPKEELKSVQGHIVLQPLDFLNDTLGFTGKYTCRYLREIPKAVDDSDDFLLFC